MKKIYIILIVAIVAILSVFLIFKFTNNKDTKEPDNNEQITENKNVPEAVNYKDKYYYSSNLTEGEKKISKILFDKFEFNKYLDYDNLKSLEITRILRLGYFESKSNVHYFQINYNITCQDGSYDCDKKLCNHQIDELANKYFFLVAIDMNTSEPVEKPSGLSTNINSDWVSTDSEIK
ncbi:MAG TPA: hypothetical protein DCE23_07000 [Firmicutes bacterium]|nr:hypothetical protein [Bacillota bacterium]